MYHMTKASVRDLRYRFHEVEDLLRQGQEIQITKRRRVIARLVPERDEKALEIPDFLARLKKIYGKAAESDGSRNHFQGPRGPLLRTYADASFLVSL